MNVSPPTLFFRRGGSGISEHGPTQRAGYPANGERSPNEGQAEAALHLMAPELVSCVQPGLALYGVQVVMGIASGEL